MITPPNDEDKRSLFGNQIQVMKREEMEFIVIGAPRSNIYKIQGGCVWIFAFEH